MIKKLKNIIIGSYLFLLFFISLFIAKYQKFKRKRKKRVIQSPKMDKTYFS